MNNRSPAYRAAIAQIPTRNPVYFANPLTTQMTTEQTPAPTELDQAAYDWTTAKAREAQAETERLAAERRILDLVGAKEEGTTKAQTAFYAISTAGKLTRTLVDDYGARLEALDPEILNRIVRYTPTLDVRALKALATSNPDAYRLVCTAIETKPAKPTVKVELREQQQEAA